MALSVGEVEATLRLKDQMSGPMRQVLTQLDAFDRSLRGVSQRAQQAGTSLTAALTLPIAAIAAASVKASIDFESSFTGIVKTVDGVVDAGGRLTEFGESVRDDMRAMAREIPVSVNELNKIGEAAGQLGVKSKDIMGFTRTIADLGVTTNLTTEEAASGLAKFANIMDNQVGPQFDRLGSVIVELGNKGASTEQDILNFGLRLASAGKIAGMSEDQILAFGSALSSVGIEAEAGGTAFSQVFQKVTEAVKTGNEDLEVFARTAGYEGPQAAQQFAQAFKNDAGGAIVSFVEGLGKVIASGQNVYGVLGELELTNARMKQSLLSAASAGDLMRKALDDASRAMKENNALTIEASRRYGTLESRLQVLWNNIYDLAVAFGDALRPAIELAIGALQTMLPLVRGAVDIFAKLPTPVQLTVAAVLLLAAAIGPLVYLVGSFGMAISGLTTIYRGWTAATSASTLATVANTAAVVTNASATATAAQTTGAAMKFAAGEQLALNFAVMQSRDELGRFVPRLWGAQQALLPLSGNSMAAAKSVTELGVAAATGGRWMAAFWSTSISGAGILAALKGGFLAAAGALGTFAAAAWPVVAAILAVWAAWKVGNSESIKNGIAVWALSADNLTAKLFRAVAGVDKMTESAALSAVAYTASAVAMNKQADAADRFKASAADVNAMTDALKGVAEAKSMDALVQSLTAMEKAGQLTTPVLNKAAQQIQSLKAAGQEATPALQALIAKHPELARSAGGAGAAVGSMTAQLKAATAAVAALEPAQRRDAEAGFKMGLSAKEVSDRLKELYPNIKFTEVAAQLLSEQLTASGKAAKDAAKDFKELSGATAIGDAESLAKQLGSGQLDLAKMTKEAQREVADALFKGAEAWRAQGKEVPASVDKQIAAVAKMRTIPDILEAHNRENREALTPLIEQTAQAVEAAQDRINAGMMKNLEAQGAAMEATLRMQEEMEGDSLASRLRLVEADFTKRRAALDQHASFYKEALDAINREEKAVVDKTTRDWKFGTAKTKAELTAQADHFREQYENMKASGLYTLEELDAAWQRWYDAQKKANDEWGATYFKNLKKIAQAFETLAEVAGDSLGRVAREIGTFIAALELGSQGVKSMGEGIAQFKDGKKADGLANIAAGAMSIAAGFMQATESGGTFAKTMKGGMFGAQIGMQIGGPLGAGIGFAIGATAGLLRGVFGGPSKQELEGREVAKRFMKGMVDSLNSKQMKELQTAVAGAWKGNAEGAATVIALRDAYLAMGKTEAEALRDSQRLWEAEKKGPEAVEKVMKEINVTLDAHKKMLANAEAFQTEFAQGLQNIAAGGRLVSREMQAVIDKVRATGKATAELQEFSRTSLTSGAGGLAGFLQEGAKGIDNLADKNKELAELQKQLAALGTGNADEIEDAVRNVEKYRKALGEAKTDAQRASARESLSEAEEKLADLRKKQSAEEAKLRDEIAKVTKEINTQQAALSGLAITSKETGDAFAAALFGTFFELQKNGMSVTEALATIEPGVTALETQLKAAGITGGDAFQQLRNLVAMTKDEISGPALRAIDALNKGLVGLHNAGILDQQMFVGLTNQVTQTYQGLVKQGKGGVEALRLMQPTLQTIWELQQDFGYAVDVSTQAMLDQAKEAGFVGDKHRDANEKIAKGLERLIELMEDFLRSLGMIPSEADKAAQAINGIPDRQVHVEFVYDENGNALPDFNEPVFSAMPVPGGDGEAIPDVPPEDAFVPPEWQDPFGYGYVTAHDGMFVGGKAYDEVPILAQTGEGILNRDATSAIGGEDAIDALNSGAGTGDNYQLSFTIYAPDTVSTERYLEDTFIPAFTDAVRRNRKSLRSELEHMLKD